jgi:hypothetical protein
LPPRHREDLAFCARLGVRKIAARFGLDRGTVQRISRFSTGRWLVDERNDNSRARYRCPGDGNLATGKSDALCIIFRSR